MEEFRLTPDETNEEKDRKRASMLKRLKQEDDVKRETRVGSGPELPPNARYIRKVKS